MPNFELLLLEPLFLICQHGSIGKSTLML